MSIKRKGVKIIISYFEAQILFTIDASTLRRWCRRVGIKPHIGLIDNRERWLDDYQISLLVWFYRLLVFVPLGTVEKSMHSWSRLCKLFEIHSSTLRRWCHSAGIVPYIGADNDPKRWFDNHQFLYLATRHKRILIVQLGTGEFTTFAQLGYKVDKEAILSGDRAYMSIQLKIAERYLRCLKDFVWFSRKPR